MGRVTEALQGLIQRQVDDHGIVVWYDPERHYEEVAHYLALPETRVVFYGGSFFALRRQVEPLIDGFEPPRLVVYVPLDQSNTHRALVELESLGVVMRPGQQPAIRNTRLALVARNALKPILGESSAVSIEKQVEAGQLTLSELDQLAEKGEGISKGTLSIIFGNDNAREVGHSFLSSTQRDEAILQKEALGELLVLLEGAFGAFGKKGASAAVLREAFARHVLVLDFVGRLHGPIPTGVAGLVGSIKDAHREACMALAESWRQRRDARESYIAQAAVVEKAIGLDSIEIDGDSLIEIETFHGIEQRLLLTGANALTQDCVSGWAKIAEQRQSQFWASVEPETQARWALIAAAGHLLSCANEVEGALRTALDTQTILGRYTGSETPWCLLDTYHRHVERLWHSLDVAADDEALDGLMRRVRDRYMEVGGRLAEAFTRAYAGGHFDPGGILLQRQIFERKVKPLLAEGKRVAFVLVDALRYEMAQDLLASLQPSSFAADLYPTLGTPPTLTVIGMAALLPLAEGEFAVVGKTSGQLSAQIGQTVLKDRKARLVYLEANAQVPVAALKLEDLLPKPSKKVRDTVANASLVLITSQEIDTLCEEDNIHLARRLMDQMLLELSRCFRVLAELGMDAIVLSADHGYLFGEELGSEMKIESPGGETISLHRRVWVGKGGRQDDAFLRANLSDLGIAGDLEIAVPWGFGSFKSPGGASAYFHGGLSPQEVVVPLAILIPKSVKAQPEAGTIRWVLTPGSSKLTTRFFSVQVAGSFELFAPMPPKVRVELREKEKGKESVLSIPVSASYGFDSATGDVQLRMQEGSNALESVSITLQVHQEPLQKVVSVHLIDAATGVEFARLDTIEVAISI
jgi:hypothetical protein